MNNNISVIDNLAQSLGEFSDKAREYMRESLSKNTRKDYANSINIFMEWCLSKNLIAFPADPNTVASFMIAQIDRGLKPSSVNVRVAAIKKAHDSQGLVSPTNHPGVKAVMQGIRRKHKMVVDKKLPITVERLKLMIGQCQNDITGVRDRALLLIGFAGALRRSELVAIQVEDIEYVDSGIKLHIRKSKTDQEGLGHMIAIPRGQLGVIEALEHYLSTAQITSGYIFRRITKTKRMLKYGLESRTISNVIKKYAALAGFDDIDSFSGHSLRAGFLTSAALHGADINKMMEVSRHVNFETTRGYIREANLFDNHAGNGFL